MRISPLSAITVVVTVASAVASTSIAFVVAGAWALGQFPWELSNENLDFDLRRGSVWGILGGILAALVFYDSDARRKLLATTGFVAGWAAAAATCFFFYISIYMMG
jgi:hypothetical protein